MKTIFCLLAFIIATATVRADLEETLEQSTARYGNPVDRKPAANVDEMIFFKRDELRISVGFKEGKCVVLIFGNDSGEKLSEEKVEALLKENSNGSLWKKSTKPSGNEVWMRADKLAAAQFSSLNGILTLVDTDYMQAQMAKKASEANISDGGK